MWQAFKDEGKGGLGRGRNARGARGGRDLLVLPSHFSCANTHLPCRLPDTCSCGPSIIQSVFIFQMYLRSWAKELSVPILSIDYSLAPEAPFPRALEECFFVYAWCLNNFHHLGTNGKRVCVAGDSAGRAFFQSLSSQVS